jgi:LacI family transcriptional regulator
VALKRPTIKDVARQAGCSLSTVSLVINTSGYVSEETRKRVLKVVRELGYHPTRSARGLASRTSGNIGFILREDHFSQAEPFYTKIFLGAEFAAREHHYYILLTTVGNRFNERTDTPRFLLERNVDGLIIAGKVNLRLVDSFERFGVPIMLVDFQVKGKRFSSVVIDNRGGARAAVTHLLDLGHKNIGFVGGDIEHPSLSERFEGYQETLRDHGLEVQQAFIEIRERDTRIANGAESMKRLLAHARHPTAVFAVNDAMAIGCMRQIKEAGLRTPEDVAVVGFDDIEMSALVEPRLTTVHVHKEELGRLGLERLVEIIDTTSPKILTTLVPVELIERESTLDRERAGTSTASVSGAEETVEQPA